MKKHIRSLRPWLNSLLLVLAVAGPSLAAFTSISRYKTFTREPLLSTDLNAWQDATNTAINNAGAYLPSGATGDSVDVENAAHDTLATRSISKIIVKDPLLSLAAADSLKFHLANFKRANTETLWVGVPNISLAFAGGGTAGKRWRFNLADIDSARLRDSLTVLPLAKANFMAGSIFTAANIAADSVTSVNREHFDSGGVTDWNSGDVTATHSSNTLTWAGAASGYVFNGGNLYINDTANGNQSLGLTVNQGANDDEILTLKSSDVAHGVTTITETDTYFEMKKRAATQGGISSTATRTTTFGSYYMQAIDGAAETTKSAAGGAPFTLDAYLINGTGTQAVTANGNLFVVKTNDLTRFIVDTEGDLFADGSDVTVYDDYDDVALISTFDHHEARVSNQQLVESEWEDYTKYHENDLIEMGLIGGPRVGVDPSQRGLVNYTGMVRLHNGAIRQVGREVNRLDSRTEELTEKVAYLEAVHGSDPTWDDVELVMRKWLYNLLGRN